MFLNKLITCNGIQVFRDTFPPEITTAKLVLCHRVLGLIFWTRRFQTRLRERGNLHITTAHGAFAHLPSVFIWNNKWCIAMWTSNLHKKTFPSK